MTPIAWTLVAREDLFDIRKYVAMGDLDLASSTVGQIVRAVELLSSTPAIGRPGRVKGTRELVMQALPYLVVYRVNAGVLEVLRVLHTARRWPPRATRRR